MIGWLATTIRSVPDDGARTPAIGQRNYEMALAVVGNVEIASMAWLKL